MSIEQTLQERSGSKCELCTSTDNLSVYEMPPIEHPSSDQSVLICANCLEQVEGKELEPNHWHCLNDSMWSQVPAVQVMAWRMLKRLDSENWAQDLLDMLYLDEETLKWAESGHTAEDGEQALTRDCNGTILEAGDTVTLIKDLDVKGAGFTAKRGTTVKNISLTNNPEQIEGRVNGVRLVLVSKFMKKG